MCLTMFDPTDGSTQYIYWLSKLTVPNKGKGKKATYILTWEIFFLQRFSFLIWVQTLEKYNSQYPSANDLVQQIVSNKQQTWCQPWLHHALCYTSGIKRKQTSVKNPHSECYTGAYSWSLHVMHIWYQWLESVKTSDINVYPNRQ